MFLYIQNTVKYTISYIQMQIYTTTKMYYKFATKQLQNHHLFLCLFICGMRRVTFLPQELSGS